MIDLRILLMGSAAAEGWPGLWCNCDVCQRAHAVGGKSIRSRSGALIDDTLKVDLCPDTYMQARRDGLDLSRVTDILITHAHNDHLAVNELAYNTPPYAHDNPPVHVWGGERVIEKVKSATSRWPDQENRLHVLKPFQPVYLRDGTYVMPLEASHAADSSPLNFIIRRGDKTLLYGLDSGWYPEASWQAHAGHFFNVVIIDCTMGNLLRSSGHGTFSEAVQIKERMLAEGTADSSTIFVANHFSHNIKLLHHEIEEWFAGTGFIVGYDGLVLEV
jgi:phosphoribosyl 1,2-cyclic phosphate phosphodiesterase